MNFYLIFGLEEAFTFKFMADMEFVGAQVDICDAFGLNIPDGCSPDYRSKRKEPKRQMGLFRKQTGQKCRAGSTPACGAYKKAACPGSEGAVLKAVGLVSLAGANPVRCVSCGGREGMHPLGRWRLAVSTGMITNYWNKTETYEARWRNT